jgi:hypothetical protein
MPGMLDYEKLDVYQRAIEHLAFVFESIPKMPRGWSALTDQWRRAATSIPLNIAEAVGKTSNAERLLDVVPHAELVRAKELVVRVVGMLTRMCR